METERQISYIGLRMSSGCQTHSLIGLHASTFALWVSRLPVCGSYRLSFPSIVPPT